MTHPWYGNNYAAEPDDDLLERIAEVLAGSDAIETLSNKRTNCVVRPHGRMGGE